MQSVVASTLMGLGALAGLAWLISIPCVYLWWSDLEEGERHRRRLRTTGDVFALVVLPAAAILFTLLGAAQVIADG